MQIIHQSAPLGFSYVDLIDADDPEGLADIDYSRGILARNRFGEASDQAKRAD